MISGEPDLFSLQKAWIDIYSEYISMSDSADIKAILSIKSKIITYNIRVLKIKLIVQTLKQFYDEELIEMLRLMNFQYKYDPENHLQYQKDLDKTLSSTNGLKMKIAFLEAEYTAYENKNKGEPVNRTFFTDTLLRLSRFFKQRLKASDVTTEEFCLMKKQFYDFYSEKSK